MGFRNKIIKTVTPIDQEKAAKLEFQVSGKAYWKDNNFSDKYFVLYSS